MINAVIIDDEKKSRITLCNHLKVYCPEIKILAEADSVKSGVEQITKHQPDIIFLDIQLPDGTGFNLIEQFKEITFRIIFTTAYSQYAIKAFKFSALDYLLKPIDIDELISAVQKIKTKDASPELNSKIKLLGQNLHNPSAPFKKIILSTLDSFHFVETEKIVRCQAQDTYTMFHLESGEKILVTRTLKEFDELLQGQNFLRVHKSHLVNVQAIKKYLKSQGDIQLNDGTLIPVSQRTSLIQLIEKLNSPSR